MTQVAGQRSFIEQEEIQAESAVSEGVGKKIAESVNFWNQFFTGPRIFAANGIYDNGIQSESFVDGVASCESDCTIYAFSFYNFNAGTSGSTQIDLIVHPANGDPSYSIFSTKPSIPSTANHTPFAAIVQSLDQDNVFEILRQSTGTTAGVVDPALINLNAGDIITMSFLSKQILGANCGVQVSLRPR